MLRRNRTIYQFVRSTHEIISFHIGHEIHFVSTSIAISPILLDTDESTHSFILALNEDFEGGGTYFVKSGKTIRLRTGQILSFRGDIIEHGGETVTCGTRYIIAAFLYQDNSHNQTACCSSLPLGSTSHKQCYQPLDDNRRNSEAKQRQDDFSFGFNI
jgi:hypothetical protein